MNTTTSKFLVNYDKARDYAYSKLAKELPDNIYYHNLSHTQDVVNAINRIAKYENINGEGLVVLKTAALYHDLGFIISYEHNEPYGAQIAGDILPDYNYSSEQVKQIIEIILSTKVPRNPNNIFEKIMCDADLDYLGRDDYFVLSNALHKELVKYGYITSLKQWYEFQLNFLVTHKFYTSYSKKYREPKKKEHIAKIKKMFDNHK